MRAVWLGLCMSMLCFTFRAAICILSCKECVIFANLLLGWILDPILYSGQKNLDSDPGHKTEDVQKNAMAKNINTFLI